MYFSSKLINCCKLFFFNFHDLLTKTTYVLFPSDFAIKYNVMFNTDIFKANANELQTFDSSHFQYKIVV